MAGMLAARVLAYHFERVTIIERDGLPKELVSRKSVPQSRHVHALLKPVRTRAMGFCGPKLLTASPS